jgi:uncharacterized protein DUF4262
VLSEFHRRTAADIKRVGRTIVCVGADENKPSFAYTIGNYCVRLPELLVIGTYQGGFLNQLSRLMIARGAAFDDGELVQMLGGRFPVKAICANNSARTEYAFQVGRYFKVWDFAIMQVLLPDRNGTFPDEPNCFPPFRDVPVLRQHV